MEAPSFTGSPFNGTMSADAKDIRLTMRDVVLVRVKGGLTAGSTGDQVYAHNLVVTAAGASFRFDRGYQWVDIRSGATRFRFVNTHLEAFSSDLALAQASELLTATASDRSTVLVCDCNSDPLNSSVKPNDHVPHKAPYELITGPGRFTDEWLRWRRPNGVGPRASPSWSTIPPPMTSTIASTWCSAGPQLAARWPWTAARSPARMWPIATR